VKELQSARVQEPMILLVDHQRMSEAWRWSRTVTGSELPATSGVGQLEGPHDQTQTRSPSSQEGSSPERQTRTHRRRRVIRSTSRWRIDRGTDTPCDQSRRGIHVDINRCEICVISRCAIDCIRSPSSWGQWICSNLLTTV
jgi:hypothetical protein